MCPYLPSAYLRTLSTITINKPTAHLLNRMGGCSKHKKTLNESKPCFDWQMLMGQLEVLCQSLLSYLLLPW